MEAYNPIPTYIREIDELALSKWGQIKLAGFPEAAIVEARKAMKHSKAARNPYGLFFNAALAHCKANNLQVNWKMIDFLKETYQMPEQAPMLITTKAPRYAQQNAPMILTTKNQSQGMKGSGQSASTKAREVPEEFFKNLAGQVAAVSQEDPYAAALRVERHYETENGKRFVKYCGRINPWMEKLQKEDQQRIIDIVTNERTHEETTAISPRGESARGELNEQPHQEDGHAPLPQETQSKTQELSLRQLFAFHTQEAQKPFNEAQAINR